MSIFQGDVAVVTGGASGIGKALTAALAARGVRCVIADIALDQANAAASEIGNGARGYQCDITDRDQVFAFAQSVVTDFGRINLVFANAGVCIGGKIIDTDPKEFDWMMDVNIRGVFTTIQAFVPGLIEAAEKGQSAHFIFTGSENSLGVPPGAAASCYTATKHGVLGLADTLRRDLADTKVGVSILCPGMVDTRIWDARRTRHDRYGGTAAMPPEFAAVASKVVALGQKPELTAELCLEGVERRDFIITTDPKIRSFSSTRHREVDASLDLLDARLALKESVQ